MDIEYDPTKRATTLQKRGLDFERSVEVFAGPHVTSEDARRDYGERRFVTAGVLDGRMVVMVWTPRGNARRIISMRYAHEDEIRKLSQKFD